MKHILIKIVPLLFAFSTIAVAGDIGGKVTLKGARGQNDVIVYLQKVDGEIVPPAEPAQMDQRNLRFEPHVLPITKGTKVRFINSDDVLHNVFTPDECAGKINLGTWPKGESRDYVFNEESCVSVVLCNVHPEMEAWVLVLQNRYFARADSEGNYIIKDVPPGEYVLVAWHERLKNKEVTITVPSDGTVSQDFALSRR